MGQAEVAACSGEPAGDPRTQEVRLSPLLLSSAGGPQPSPKADQLCEGTDLGTFTVVAQQQHM